MGTRVRIPLFGGLGRSYSNATADIPDYGGTQELWNMIPVPDPTGAEAGILVPFPGLDEQAEIKTTGNTIARGMTVYSDPTDDYAEYLSCIIGNDFYRSDNSSNNSFSVPATISSAIDTDVGDIKMVNFQSGSTSQVAWAKHRSGSFGVGYYDPPTDTQDIATGIGSSAANGSPLTIATINRQIIGHDGESWFTSAPGSLSLDSTNRLAEAEAFPDRILRVLVSHPYLYVFGTRSCEIYQNTGSGKPPFSRLPTGVLQVGLRVGSAATSYNGTIYFIDDEGRPAAMVNGQVSMIGNREIDSTMGTAGVDSTVSGMNLSGTDVIMFALRRQVNTSTVSDTGVYLYFPAYGVWSRMGDPSQNGTAANVWGNSYFAKANGRDYLLHKNNGTLYRISGIDLSYEGSSFGGDQLFLTSRRVTSPVTSESLGGPADSWVYASRLVLYTAPGQAESSGASISMRYSDDGGETWSTAKTALLGSSGSYGQEVYWSSLGRFKQRTFEISYTPTSSTSNYIPFFRLYADVNITGTS